MLKNYKEEADNYIEDPETQKFEEEEQEIYREELRLVGGKFRKHLKGRRHEESSEEEESLAIRNREKWQAKPVAGKSA